MHSVIINILVVFAPLVSIHKINMLFNQNLTLHQQPSAFRSALIDGNIPFSAFTETHNFN